MASRGEYFARWAELHGGYDPSGSRLLGRWLRLVHAGARPLAAARVPPWVVTVAGGLTAWGAALAVLAGRSGPSAWLYVAAGLVALSGALDAVDGTVALLEGRTSAVGHILDSLVDRLADLAYVVALWWAGAPGPLCAAAGATALLLEYLRARAYVAGMHEIGVVTVWERPSRVLVTCAALLAVVVAAPWWASAGAWAWLVLGLVGFGQLSVVVVRRLRGVTPPG
jgi:CDP-diacylglycerol--glycerol-3-phosphate 3-phosphatidyltransferase